MSVAVNVIALILAALAIGAIAGAGLGRVIGDRKGAIVGGVAGGAGAALFAYMIAAGALAPGNFTFSILLFLAVLGCGLMAGFFFAFSVLVMKALAQQPPAAGMATMQTINLVVFNPVFGAVFSAIPVLCVLLMILSLFSWSEPAALSAFAGGALYIIGTLGVTALCNVPRNDALAAAAPTAEGAGSLWSRYLDEWTVWNHVRTIAALAAAASLIVALMRG